MVSSSLGLGHRVNQNARRVAMMLFWPSVYQVGRRELLGQVYSLYYYSEAHARSCVSFLYQWIVLNACGKADF